MADNMVIENGKITCQGKKADIVWLNERILKHGMPDDARGYPRKGNCLAPEVLNGDIVIVTSEFCPANGDMVLVEHPDRGCYFQRYRANGNRRWVTSRHGDMSLNGWSVAAVAVLVARYPNEEVTMNGQEYVKIPVVNLGPLPAI